jgi:hypothetical protein
MNVGRLKAMTETEKRLIRMLIKVRDSPSLGERNDAVAVDSKTWRQIRDLLALLHETKSE